MLVAVSTGADFLSGLDAGTSIFYENVNKDIQHII